MTMQPSLEKIYITIYISDSETAVSRELSSEIFEFEKPPK